MALMVLNMKISISLPSDEVFMVLIELFPSSVRPGPADNIKIFGKMIREMKNLGRLYGLQYTAPLGLFTRRIKANKLSAEWGNTIPLRPNTKAKRTLD